jgi:ATP-dependent Lhr-like helicase
LVDLVEGDPGAEPDLSILIPGRARSLVRPLAASMPRKQVMEMIAANKTTLVFCNTRSLAELTFQELWAE